MKYGYLILTLLFVMSGGAQSITIDSKNIFCTNWETKTYKNGVYGVDYGIVNHSAFEGSTIPRTVTKPHGYLITDVHGQNIEMYYIGDQNGNKVKWYSYTHPGQGRMTIYAIASPPYKKDVYDYDFEIKELTYFRSYTTQCKFVVESIHPFLKPIE